MIWDLRGVPEKKLMANRNDQGALSSDEQLAATRVGAAAPRKRSSTASTLGKKAGAAKDLTLSRDR